MENLLSIFVKSMFIDNMVFAYFFGMCSFIAVSKSVKTAMGLGGRHVGKSMGSWRSLCQDWQDEWVYKTRKSGNLAEKSLLLAFKTEL